MDGAHDAGRNPVPVKLINSAPGYLWGFLGAGDVARFRIQCEDQIVVEVKGLALVGGDAVDIHSDQARESSGRDPYRRFLHSFAPSRIRQRGVALFDMPARQKPAAKAVMIDQQSAPVIRMEHQRCTGDVAGMELVARERSLAIFQERENQLAAFFFLR